ncbi:MAG: ABC transporter permease [Planctomycetes bacterium]|nr:ABC transporter permease [Planctomycetota bacterium]
MARTDPFAHLNPILLKDVRAAFRTRRFAFTFMTYLSVLGAVIFIMLFVQLGSSKNVVPSDVGRDIFLTFILGLGVVTWFLVPAFACAALTGEREGETFDLLITTSFRPWDIVWGKLLASFAYVFVFYAGSLPLVCLSFLFGGVSPGQIGCCYLALTLAALFVISLSLMFSAVYTSSKRAVSSTYAILVFSGFPLLGMIIGLFEDRGSLRRVLAGVPLPVFFLTAVLYLSAIVLCLLCATNALKSPTENRSTNTRLFLCAFTALVTALGLWTAWEEMPAGKDLGWLLGIWLGVLGGILLLFPLLFCAEPPQRSRRLQFELGQHRPVLRPLMRLLYPGALSGFAFSLIWCTGLMALTAAALWILIHQKRADLPLFSETSTVGTAQALLVLPLALVFLLFFASLCLLMSYADFRTKNIRTVMLFLIVLSNVLPGVILVSAERRRADGQAGFNLYGLSPSFAEMSILMPPSTVFKDGSVKPLPILRGDVDFRGTWGCLYVKLDSPFDPRGVMMPQWVVAMAVYLSLSLVMLVLCAYLARRRRPPTPPEVAPATSET